MKRNSIARQLFVLMFAILAALVVYSCTPEGEMQPVQFEVIDSLLGDTVTVPAARVQFRVPRNFNAVDGLAMSGYAIRKRPAYADRWNHVELNGYKYEKGGSLVVTQIDSLGLSGDTAGFMSAVRAHLVALYGERNLTWGDYPLGGLFVKNLLVTDSNNVQFYLFLFGPTTTTVQLRFFVPRSEYSELLKPLESSIGSAHVIDSVETTTH